MPGIPTSKKVCCVCVNSSFSLRNTNCTYAKHDQLTVTSCFVNNCWDIRDGFVVSSADHVQVSKGQTLKLFHLELLKSS